MPITRHVNELLIVSSFCSFGLLCLFCFGLIGFEKEHEATLDQQPIIPQNSL